jgi:Tol biopolymer transport system component
MNADGSNPLRFTTDEATDQAPAWSPDGKQIAWESYRDGNLEIYVAEVAGGEPRNLSQDDFANDHGPAWSPDSRRIAYYSNRDGGWDIYTLDLESGERENITAGTMLEQGPSWGP